jgi:peptidoglycan/LPS O-acetylase OafA/YrhL
VRIFSYIFHLLLGVALVALGFVAWSGGRHTLQIPILPWTGRALTMWVFFGGLAGILITLMAIRRKLRFLFLLWSLAVVVLLVRGYFFSSYHFRPGGFLPALAFVAAAILALAGSVLTLRRRTT